MLETVGRIVGRMAELKGMATQDPLKSSQDVESYNNEFVDLQKQLYDISRSTFNGVSLFASKATDSDGSVGSTDVLFKGNTSADNTIKIFTSSEGSTGTKVSLYKVGLLSALTIDASSLTTAQAGASGVTGTVFGLFSDGCANGISLNASGLSMGVFEQAVSNVAYLRAQAGGGMFLNFASESISSMETNLRSAIGRIEDVDIAAESAKPRQVLNINAGRSRDGWHRPTVTT